ncbi:MAG: alpha/beta hydrolase-fold protein [Acidobacteriota bacterium]|nr:alpha/beta hydrolase-fold protein [Acidobacteriota bacterium]
MLFMSLGTISIAETLRFAVSFPSEQSQKALEGRILLMISDDEIREPRFLITRGPDSQLVFGIEVEELEPGENAVIGKEVFGYPLDSLSEIPPGEYWVQGLLNRYETFHRSDGHTVKLAPDKGEGQRWNSKPGNLYSKPEKFWIDPREDKVIEISLDRQIPPIPDPPDTKYIRHVRIQSRLLTEFWGRPMFLGANVLLPEGFDEHPEARYPLIINHGHFPYTFGGFRETPPDPDLEPEYSSRFNLPDYNITVQEYAYKFYQYWTAPDTPRMIIMEIQHANPFYDSSYAVNSANVGPYGDAITYELIPYVEKTFRGLGQGWSRFLYGGSTGGWQSLAAQVFYPEDYNGCYAACPDPIDFRAYTSVNIYKNKNAYYLDTPWKQTPRPRGRNFLGEILFTLKEACHLELVLGSKGRSGGQQDIWEATFGPVGDDGYPRPIWDRMTGAINPEVAKYWRDNYDLRYLLEKNWKTIGPKLKGKIHIYVGDMDNYYLNNAVYFMEEFLEKTTEPHYGGEIDYGDRQEHCWNGDHELPNAISRLRYHQMFIPKILDRILKTAPPSADTTSWRY